MNKAYQEWRNGREEWDIFNGAGEKIATVLSESELQPTATIDTAKNAFVPCECIRQDEPRFLVRDQSGRGWCAETPYTAFTHEEREYANDPEDEFGQTFGEWLDNSSAGDEYNHEGDVFDVIRIN